ncbi:hypothetical protein [Pseudomonas citrulli]|uniref:Uncharacterized protein n=1 Tax=Pseudomonas citrulli TaxID=3064347 RepID=A0ABT9C655_9PSED|nr:hypothetical protein [Pseudomonas sp. K18]MDO7900290.1 hypothetical protein [Pseudomonas sp. K18]
METNSVDALLDWLEAEPRTLRWGAILAYGRSETNKVLAQEYITRFATSDYMQPITEEIRDNTTPTQKDYLHNYQMDAPRLSFKGSNLQTSAAKLTMKEVGGTHLSFTKQVGAQQWSLTRIAEKNVLDGPGLTFDINLIASEGSVTSAGRVELDISEGRNYRLIDMPSDHLQRVAGERFQTRFRGLPQAQRTFVLNELSFQPDQFLKPAKFVIRTHNKQGAGARLMANEDEGEGAVLVFVAMEGANNGIPPTDNADLKYLLPDGYSATVLLSNDMLVRNIFAEGIRRTNNLDEEFRAVFEVVGGFTEMTGYGGRFAGISALYADPANEGDNHFAVTSRSLNANFHEPEGSGDVATFRVRRLSRGVVLEWNSQRMQFCDVRYKKSEFAIVRYLGSEWECVWRFQFRSDPASGTIVFELIEQPGQIKVTGSIGTFQDQPRVVQVFPQVKAKLEEKLVSLLSSGVQYFLTPAPEINVFTLNSLLFRGRDSVRFDSVYFPGDLAAFGHVGPTLTAFTITDLEPIIPHTLPWQFQTEPRRNDLTWSVRNILGETVPKGSITATGLYTPPTAAEMPRSSIRVVVTATDGTHTSSALVGITSRSLAINPLIMIATAGDSLAHDVSAGAVDGGALTWSIQDPGSGAVVRPNPADGKDHSYVPGPPIAKSPPTVDTIVVTNPRTGLSETTSALVLHRAPVIEVAINETANLPENQLQLSIMAEDGPINPGDWNEQWQVLLGGGSAQIDAVSGLLTLNPAGPDKFLVITVLAPPARPGGASEDGYIVLPLPLFNMPETIRMFRADGQ